MNRQEFAQAIEAVGMKANELREEANRRNNPFIVGMLRAAEETLLVAFNTVGDPNVPDSEL